MLSIGCITSTCVHCITLHVYVCCSALGGADGEGVRVERLDSQTTDSCEDDGGQVSGKKRRRRKNRQHKKLDWEAALKNLQLRVMAK